VRRSEETVAGQPVPVVSCNTLIVGSGAAALGAAVSLHAAGVRDVVVVSESLTGGTSLNAGSDKQTYYKLALAGLEPDSARDLAGDLAAGGCMHGDIALIEAGYSARAFHRLVELGVPFPRDRYGAFVGYRTDHDRRGRATSAGPLTSRFMTEALRTETERCGIPLLDAHQVIALVTSPGEGGTAVVGAIALDLTRGDGEGPDFVLFNAVNVILGTGGPGGLYAHSVYPESQFGSTGMALRAGARACNLTESQYGLASTSFRWNLSGSYQQVLPRYLSTAPDSGDEREFLTESFADREDLLRATFLKGYEWPFDPRKIAGGGSSLIDLLVWREQVERGRRVFLDFTVNPAGMAGEEMTRENLPDEAGEYLAKSGALAATPIERLELMNPAAVELYRDHGIDLARDRLEIAVCAQHCNGGLEAGVWWESNLRHLFCVGEVNGTHGVYRPGGSALNAGQVGGMRAAEYIAARYAGSPPDMSVCLAAAGPALEAERAFLEQSLAGGSTAGRAPAALIREIGERMSTTAAHVRRPADVDRALAEARALHDAFGETVGIASLSEAGALFQARDLAVTHLFWLEAIAAYLSRGGGSRGSYLVPDPAGVTVSHELGEYGCIRIGGGDLVADSHILTLQLSGENEVVMEWIEPRPIPASDLWFEEIWAEYRAGRIYD